MSGVLVKVIGPKSILERCFWASPNLDKTWYTFLYENGVKLKPSDCDTIRVATSYRRTTMIGGNWRGWSADLNDEVGEFLSKFKRQQKIYTVRLYHIVSEKIVQPPTGNVVKTFRKRVGGGIQSLRKPATSSAGNVGQKGVLKVNGRQKSTSAAGEGPTIGNRPPRMNHVTRKNGKTVTSQVTMAAASRVPESTEIRAPKATEIQVPLAPAMQVPAPPAIRQVPVAALIQVPVAAPIQVPVAAPIQVPVAAPIQVPVAAPIQVPVAGPSHAVGRSALQSSSNPSGNLAGRAVKMERRTSSMDADAGDQMERQSDLNEVEASSSDVSETNRPSGAPMEHEDDFMSQYTTASQQEEELRRAGIEVKNVKALATQRLLKQDKTLLLRIRNELQGLKRKNLLGRNYQRAPLAFYLLEDILKI